MEGIVRISVQYLSENIRHIRHIPEIFHEMAARSNHHKTSVIFMGNSLIGNAVDAEQFNKINSYPGKNSVKAYKVVPDSTNLWDWYCLTKTNSTLLQSAPNIMVVGFAWDQLEDDQDIVPSRLAGLFCELSDLPELVNMGMSKPSVIFEFIVANFSRLYSLRETIQKRLLDKIIPDYQEYTQRINMYKRRDLTDGDKPEYHADSYHLLSKFINRYTGLNATVVFIAMPVIKEYAIDPVLIQTIHKNGALLYDYRSMEGLNEEMYLDPIHLGDVGRAVFTSRVSDELSVILNKQAAQIHSRY